MQTKKNRENSGSVLIKSIASLLRSSSTSVAFNSFKVTTQSFSSSLLDLLQRFLLLLFLGEHVVIAFLGSAVTIIFCIFSIGIASTTARR